MKYATGTSSTARIAPLLVTLAIAAACSPPSEQPVALFGERPVSCAEFDRYARYAGGQVPGSNVDEALRRRRLLEGLAVQRGLAEAAAESGAEKEPGFSKRWQRTRRAVLVAALEAELASAVEVTEEEVRRRYLEHRDRFRRPESISTRFILSRLSADATPAEEEDARQRLLRLRERHLAGEAFGALARKHSDAENAASGGAVAASPRGSLLEAYEEAAWKLAPGQVSDPVKLPDGVGLILLEKVFPAVDRSFDEAGPAVLKRLQREKARAGRDGALAEARSQWPVRIDLNEAWSGSSDGPVVQVADSSLSLEELELEHRPPRLEERVGEAVDRRLLARLAVERRLDERPDVESRLSFLRERLLAAPELERRVLARLAELPEEQLRAAYSKRREQLTTPELRSFAAVIVAGEDGHMRHALAEAREIDHSWRSTGRPPDDRRQELWGPCRRADLGNATSPELARIAFSLEPGQLSGAVRLERYSKSRSRYVAEGYVVLKLEGIRAAHTPSFEHAGDDLLRIAGRRQRTQIEEQIRRAVLESLHGEIYSDALDACPLSAVVGQ